MAVEPGFDRRALLKGGLTVTAVGALGVLGTTTIANAAIRGGSAGARVAEPRIYSCDEWSARPAEIPITVENHKPTYIVVHHTADPGNSEDYSLAHAKAICRDIQTFHMDTRGWGDTGQQFTNSRGGYRLEGRHRSLEIVRGGTQHVQGANVGNHNSEVIGIENEGIYTSVNVPQALWDSLVQLVAWIASQYGIDPSFIKGHRDFNSTECPGTILYGRLPELRTAVGNTLGVRYAEKAEWPLLKPGDTGTKVLAAQHLLRNNGANVPTDGVFGQSTKDAVAKLAAARGVRPHTCQATARTDETGFLGADIWPLITTAVKPGTGNDAARAASVLASGRNTGTLASSQAWKDLLAN